MEGSATTVSDSSAFTSGNFDSVVLPWAGFGTAKHRVRNDENLSGAVTYNRFSPQSLPMPLQPSWPSGQLSPLDTPYLSFFLTHIPSQVPLNDLFPDFLRAVFPRILQSRPLLHTVIAVSSAVADTLVARPSERSILHKSQAIQSVQESLSPGKVDEDVALSIFILLSMDAFNPVNGKTISKAHLQGFSLVLKELGINTQSPLSLISEKVSPELMLVWRLTLRLDSGISLVQRTPTILPHPSTYELSVQRNWIQCLARDGRSADIALATFSLDDFGHRAVDWIFEGIKVKTMSERYQTDEIFRKAYDALTEERMWELQKEHANWILQSPCQEMYQKELLLQQESAQSLLDAPTSTIPNAPFTISSIGDAYTPTVNDTFLNYPPLRIYDSQFIHLLSQWRSNKIFLSLARNVPNHHSRFPSDIHNAVEICRAHASRRLPLTHQDLVPELFALLSCGYAFGGNRVYEREFEWVYGQIWASVREGEDTGRGGLEEFKGFFGQAEIVHRGLPEWSLVEEDGV
jgi:hypothetical protein